MIFKQVSTIKVGIDFGSGPLYVGRLAIRERIVYFEYERSFIERGLEISPLRLPLQPGLKRLDAALFDGLPGVFNDSLPDGWGRLLFDRALRAQGLMPAQATPLDRLAYVGTSGMGALTYEPAMEPGSGSHDINLDWLASQALEVLEGQADEVIGELLALNGSSAGARPKAMIGYNPKTGAMTHARHDLPEGFEPWLVKFPNTQDGKDTGAIEYVYALMARAAGIEMTETHLFPARRGAGFFATRRFDRIGKNRLHTHTASGLLHADHRTPSLDYEDLIALTLRLTRDVRETEKIFRLAVFNVLGHNRDDHAKNFTYLMDAAGNWSFSPAYDLTFSSGPGGEQTTMVEGEGRAPGDTQLLALSKEASLAPEAAKAIIAQTREALSQWTRLAKEHGVSASSVRLIAGRIERTGR
jgi:serine/threonine-protein kinase HipA